MKKKFRSNLFDRNRTLFAGHPRNQTFQEQLFSTKTRRILRIATKKTRHEFIFCRIIQENTLESIHLPFSSLLRLWTMETVPVDARNAPYNPMKPLVKSVKYADRLRPQFRPVWDINDSAAFHKPTFSKTYGKRSTLPIEPSATVLVESFFPDSLLEEMAMKTNQYAASLLPQSKRIADPSRHSSPSSSRSQ